MPHASQTLTLKAHPAGPEVHPAKTTRAPTDTWFPLVEWASAAGCFNELGLLALVCQSTKNPEWLGTVFHRMSAFKARQLLIDWTACLPELESLNTLAYEVSVTSSPVIPSALPASVPPERQLRGSLSTAFIVASLIDPAPPARHSRQASAFPEWFDTLRLWLLGQAWIRGLRRNYLDQNLRTVTDAVRHAAGRDPGWLKLLSELYEPLPADFESVSNALRRKAQARLLASDEDLAGAERRVLQAIIRLAKNEDAPIAVASSEDDEFRVQVPNRFSQGDGGAPIHPLPGLEEGDSDLVVDLDEGADTDGQRVACFVGKAAETPTQRNITGKTILLRSNEFGQYLPWSWHQLTPQERTAIEAWLESQPESFGQDVLIASMTWISLVTGYSLAQVLNFGVAGDAHGDWQLSTELDALFRKPPRPSYMRELPSAVAEVLATPASVHTIRLPEWIRAALAGATPISAPKKLADFWTSVTETPSQAFSRIATARGFVRVTTSMLGHVLGYSLYHRTSDCLFALAGSAHARTAMPGAGAYPSWGAREVLDYYRGLGNESPLEIGPEGDSVNALGSRLRVAEKSFSSALNKVFRGLESQMLQGAPIDQHNAYVTALVLKLLAATGSRPVGDPFESPLHFDLEHHRVFVADKLVVGAEGGRLVPIPKSLSVDVQHYFRYLAKLATLLAPAEPALSAGLRGLHELNAPFLLPLFFYLRADGWESISEDGLRRHLAGEFSAPLNIFRHRLPVVLRAKDVDLEVVDGLLGHGYGGCVTYGDWSTRQWQADMERVVPALEAAFDELALPILKVPVLHGAPEILDRQALPIVPFGVARRKLEQRKRREAARRQARALIEDWLRDRKVEEITAENLTEIERMVITTPSGMPHVMAPIRYAVLQRYFNLQLRRGTTSLRLRRSYIDLNEDPPFTNELAARAPAVVKQLFDLLPVLRKAFPPSRATAGDAWLMGCLHLMLESRLANCALLKEISNPKVIRLVHFQRRYWLEYSVDATAEAEDDIGASPSLRFPISRDCAAYLEASRKPGRNKRHLHKKLTEALLSHQVELSNLSELRTIELLANYVDQNNRLCLPGLLAGVLSGRVSSTSLGHHDWVRLETGTFLERPQLGDDQTACDQLTLSPEGADPNGADEARVVGRQVEARLYFRGLRKAIDGVDTDRSTKGRRGMVSAVSAIVTEFRPRVSSALYLVGEWLSHLVGKVRRLSSVRRYLSGISPAAERVWYDAELLSADEEEVSELYSALLDARPEIELSTVVDYLKRFHAFARKFALIADPDWGELSVGQAGLSVRPAYIRESDYLSAFQHILASSTREGQDVSTAGAMVLLLAYRYGLRASEATGLIRADWVGDTSPLILIRNNVLRRLKTTAGRRLVPTLFAMTPAEMNLIKRVLVTSEANHGGDMAAPLLGVQVKVPSTIGHLRTIVIQALRRATGNPTAVIHSARHSFATRVLDSLFLPDGGRPQKGHLDMPVVQAMRDRLLGSARQSRRTLWGLARLLGHASPATSIGSYAHVIDRWLDGYVDDNVTRRTRGALLEGVYDLDAEPKGTACHESRDVEDQASPVFVGAFVRLARLISRGANLQRSASALAIPEELAEQMAVALETIFRVSAKRLERNKSLAELMATITESQWENLIKFADEIVVPRDVTWSKVPTVLGLSGLVGPQRHIVMWRVEHFEWVGQFVKSTNFQKTEISILLTPGFTKDQRAWIDSHNLSRFVSTEGKEAQLDTVRTEGGHAVVVERAVVVGSRRKEHPVSNRALLSLILIAWSSAVSIT